MLIRITAKHFVAGVVPRVKAAPIVHYMKDWSVDRIKQYCNRKGWRVQVINQIGDGDD